MKFQDLTGKRFYRLTAIKRVENKGNKTMWLCKCDCGNYATVCGAYLTNGHTKSCGCYSRERSKTHGHHDHPLYRVWLGIRTRCYNSTDSSYKNYGGRGIKMCDEWLNNFKSFYDWSIANGYKNERLESGRNKWTVDRIDNNGDYCPENCRWTDQKTQANNTRRNRFITINGESRTLEQWTQILGVARESLRQRDIQGLKNDELLKSLEEIKKK